MRMQAAAHHDMLWAEVLPAPTTQTLPVVHGIVAALERLLRLGVRARGCPPCAPRKEFRFDRARP